MKFTHVPKAFATKEQLQAHLGVAPYLADKPSMAGREARPTCTRGRARLQPDRRPLHPLASCRAGLSRHSFSDGGSLAKAGHPFPLSPFPLQNVKEQAPGRLRQSKLPLFYGNAKKKFVFWACPHRNLRPLGEGISGQVGGAHEEAVALAGGAAALVGGPNDQALPAAPVNTQSKASKSGQACLQSL